MAYLFIANLRIKTPLPHLMAYIIEFNSDYLPGVVVVVLCNGPKVKLIAPKDT